MQLKRIVTSETGTLALLENLDLMNTWVTYTGPRSAIVNYGLSTSFHKVFKIGNFFHDIGDGSSAFCSSEVKLVRDIRRNARLAERDRCSRNSNATR